MRGFGPNRQNHLMSTNYLRLLILAIVFTFSPAFAAMNLVIYTDRLENGFEDHSWMTRNLTNQSPVHSGVYIRSPSVRRQIWQALYFYHTNFNSAPYESVSFWAHGGKGGQQIQVQGLLDGKTPSDDTYSRADLTNNWQEITVTLEALDVVGKTNFNGIWIQETPDSPDSPFYIDDVQLSAQKPPAASGRSSGKTGSGQIGRIAHGTELK